MDYYDYLGKIIVVGDPGVGKSSFSSVISKGNFFKDYVMTIGVDFFATNILLNNVYWKFHIWDTAGQENFKSITKTYYKDSAICFLVFDINEKKTFTSLEFWLNEVNNENENILFFLIGNKDDLNKEKLSNNTVSELQIKQFVKKHDIDYYQVSSKHKQIFKYYNKTLENMDIKIKKIEHIFFPIITKFNKTRDKNNNRGIKPNKIKQINIKKDQTCLTDCETKSKNYYCC